MQFVGFAGKGLKGNLATKTATPPAAPSSSTPTPGLRASGPEKEAAADDRESALLAAGLGKAPQQEGALCTPTSTDVEDAFNAFIQEIRLLESDAGGAAAEGSRDSFREFPQDAPAAKEVRVATEAETAAAANVKTESEPTPPSSDSPDTEESATSAALSEEFHSSQTRKEEGRLASGSCIEEDEASEAQTEDGSAGDKDALASVSVALPPSLPSRSPVESKASKETQPSSAASETQRVKRTFPGDAVARRAEASDALQTWVATTFRKMEELSDFGQKLQELLKQLDFIEKEANAADSEEDGEGRRRGDTSGAAKDVPCMPSRLERFLNLKRRRGLQQQDARGSDGEDVGDFPDKASQRDAEEQPRPPQALPAAAAACPRCRERVLEAREAERLKSRVRLCLLKKSARIRSRRGPSHGWVVFCRVQIRSLASALARSLGCVAEEWASSMLAALQARLVLLLPTLLIS